MKTPLRLLGALLVTLTIALSTKEARALGPIGIEVGAKVGYASNAFGGSANAFGVGVGGRGGVVLFDSLYAGINVVDYLGNNNASSLQYGAELGYGLKLAVLTIRPQIGLGNITSSYSILGFSANSGSFYLEPGVTALITIGFIYFGADVNALIITSSPDGGGINTAVTVHGQLGVSF
jgi:hypothetical protein